MDFSNVVRSLSSPVDRLYSNFVFGYNCGFNVLGLVPSTSTFSRFLNQISREDFTQSAIWDMNLYIGVK
ncbi:transposase [Thermoanaerobacterium thermosaccharolyticum]|uniref:transposase n=1 Tax=Thermoanaerobacterium thermosaccharolyticum TaxID=1517 RepID=UPI003DA88CC2